MFSTELSISGVLCRSFSPEDIFHSLSYLPDSPAIHKRIYKRVDENGRCRVVIGNPNCSFGSNDKYVYNLHCNIGEIKNQHYTVNVKYCKSRFFALKYVHFVALKTSDRLSLVVYLAMVSSNNLKYLQGADCYDYKCGTKDNCKDKIRFESRPKSYNIYCDEEGIDGSSGLQYTSVGYNRGIS